MGPKKTIRQGTGPTENVTRVPTTIEQARMLGIFAARIAPHVPNRVVFREYLKMTNWDFEAAIVIYRYVHARMIVAPNYIPEKQGNDPKKQSDSPPPEEGQLRLLAELDIPSLSQYVKEQGGFQNILKASEDKQKRKRGTKGGLDATTGKKRKKHKKKQTGKDRDGNDEDEEESNEDKKDDDRDAYIMPANANYEHERREAVVTMRIRILKKFGKSIVMSPAEAVLMLAQHHWDHGEAVRHFTNQENSRRILARAYGRMRAPIREATIDNPHTADQLKQQGERIAELISITGRSDWYAMRDCLEQSDWNLIDAVNEWYSRGIAPVWTPAHIANGGLRLDQTLRPRQMPIKEWTDAVLPAGVPLDWIEESLSFSNDVSRDSSDDSSSAEDEQGKPKKRNIGFPIDHDNGAMPRGLRNDKCFLIEYITAGGGYSTNRFARQQDFRWPKEVKFTDQQNPRHKNDNPGKSQPVDFDWNNQVHMNTLNAWRRQCHQRITGRTLRIRAQHWSEEENDFLYQLSEELLEKELKKNPDKTEDDLLPMTVSEATKKDWAKRMNKKFTGTKQPDSEEVRQDRKPASIMSQRNRLQAMVDRFKLPPDEQYFERKAKKAKKDAAAGAAVKKQPKCPAKDRDNWLAYANPSGYEGPGSDSSSSEDDSDPGDDKPSDPEGEGEGEVDKDEDDAWLGYANPCGYEGPALQGRCR